MSVCCTKTRTAGLKGLAVWIVLLAVSRSPCPAADFWVPDDAGRITHTWTADESLVMCMQGRKVVMQVQASTDKGVNYTVRFFHVKEDYFKRVMYQVGRDRNPTVQINGQPLTFGSPTTATFDGMLTLPIRPTRELLP